MQIHRGYFYGPEVDWWPLGVVKRAMMVGEQPFIIPDDICSKHPLNLSRNALSILKGVGIIFYFNCAQVVVLWFM